MAQGKKRLRRGMRKRIDWNAIIKTQFAAWRLKRPLSLEAALGLSQDEREAIQREADALRACSAPGSRF